MPILYEILKYLLRIYCQGDSLFAETKIICVSFFFRFHITIKVKVEKKIIPICQQL